VARHGEAVGGIGSLRAAGSGSPRSRKGR
jgi:hypothetical protein